MSRETPIRFALEVGDEAAPDLPRDLFVDFAGIEAADVVRLEDVGVDVHLVDCVAGHDVTPSCNQSASSCRRAPRRQSTITLRPTWQLRPTMASRMHASRLMRQFGQMMAPSMTAVLLDLRLPADHRVGADRALPP